MKFKTFLIFGTIISSLLLASCNSNGSFDSGTIEESHVLSSESIVGAWSYEDPFLGKVFLQFEADGTLRTYTNYEGEVINICQWQLIGNKITVNSDCTFFNELEITDFEYGSFNIQANNNVSEGNGILHVARLFDEAGEPILYYSLFERDAHSDPRYDNGSNKSEEINNSAANNESNSQSTTRTCKWCGDAFSDNGYYYSNTVSSGCRAYTDSWRFAEYCSQKCAIEACQTEH